jgi:hypothetical protein
MNVFKLKISDAMMAELCAEPKETAVHFPDTELKGIKPDDLLFLHDGGGFVPLIVFGVDFRCKPNCITLALRSAEPAQFEPHIETAFPRSMQ